MSLSPEIQRVLNKLQPKTATAQPQMQGEVRPQTYVMEDGESYVNPGVGGILAASEKLLAINRGLAEPDNRDALQFKRVHNTHDMIREHIVRDAGKIRRQMMRRLAKIRSLKAVHPGYFDSYVESQLVGNPLSSPLEEINPMHLVENSRRMTLMGPGGIGSADAVTEDAQSISADQFGFIAPLSGPECFDGASEVLTDRGWVRWDEVQDDDLFAVPPEGRDASYAQASRIIREPYVGELLVLDGPDVHLKLTPTHRVFARPDHRDEEEERPAQAWYGRPLWLPAETGPDRLVLRSGWSRVQWDQLVYCATVPGGRLLVRGKPGTTGIWTGNSERAGIDTRFAYGTKLGSDGRLYQRFYDRRQKKHRWMSPEDLDGLVVKLPD